MGAGSATAPLDYHGEAKTASCLSNHSPEPDHVCAHRTQRRICNIDSKVIVTLWALYTICVQESGIRNALFSPLATSINTKLMCIQINIKSDGNGPLIIIIIIFNL